MVDSSGAGIPLSFLFEHMEELIQFVDVSFRLRTDFEGMGLPAKWFHRMFFPSQLVQACGYTYCRSCAFYVFGKRLCTVAM